MITCKKFIVMQNTIKLTVHLQPLEEVEQMNTVSEKEKLLEKLLSIIYWFKKKKLLPWSGLQQVVTEIIIFLEESQKHSNTSHYENLIKKFKILEQQF